MSADQKETSPSEEVKEERLGEATCPCCNQLLAVYMTPDKPDAVVEPNPEAQQAAQKLSQTLRNSRSR